MRCQWCDAEITYGTTCREHHKDATGQGELKCQICQEPQRDHELGYREHAAGLPRPAR